MTWVIGFPSWTGYAAAVADIQVTVTDANSSTHYLDCLQKIYPVGRWIIAGFSGDVEIGFRLIEGLRSSLQPPPDSDPNGGWIPEAVASQWPERASEIFARSHSTNRENGSEMVLAAVHPTRNTKHGPNVCPDSYACVMRAPGYEPILIRQGKVDSIGSGNDIEKYRALLERQNTHPVDLMWGDIMGAPGMSADILAHTLGLDVEKSPAHGISKHFHLGVVRRGEITIKPNDWWESLPDGGRRVVRAPPCATDWSSLRALLQQAGVAASQAPIA